MKKSVSMAEGAPLVPYNCALLLHHLSLQSAGDSSNLRGAIVPVMQPAEPRQ